MAKVTAYFSASEKDIIAVVGDGLAQGNMALCTSGTKSGDTFDTKESAIAGLPTLFDDIKKLGAIGFLIHGGALNADAAERMVADGYEEIGSIEIEE